MRVFAHMVVRNERERYLHRVLEQLALTVDVVHIVDDRSDDGTFEWLMDEVRHEVPVEFFIERRHTTIPSFAVDEAEFRQWAWWMLGQLTLPGDWVLAIDADELFVKDGVGNLSAMHDKALLRHIIRQSVGARRFRVLEAFDLKDGWPMIRTDGAWNMIEARRLVPYAEHFEIKRRERRAKVEVPSDSVPWGHGRGELAEEFAILHLGYIRPGDRVAKYDRYRRDGRHVSSHVESILRRPVLQPWFGHIEGIP